MAVPKVFTEKGKRRKKKQENTQIYDIKRQQKKKKFLFSNDFKNFKLQDLMCIFFIIIIISNFLLLYIVVVFHKPRRRPRMYIYLFTLYEFSSFFPFSSLFYSLVYFGRENALNWNRENILLCFPERGADTREVQKFKGKRGNINFWIGSSFSFFSVLLLLVLFSPGHFCSERIRETFPVKNRFVFGGHRVRNMTRFLKRSKS